jgi:hypothetical protein
MWIHDHKRIGHKPVWCDISWLCTFDILSTESVHNKQVLRYNTILVSARKGPEYAGIPELLFVTEFHTSNYQYSILYPFTFLYFF